MYEVQMAPEGPLFSRFVAGFWRLDSWELSPKERLALIEAYLDRGITAMDHADIYGGFRNEALFGEALAIKPDLRHKMSLITKCDIAMVCDSFPARKINHYDTSKRYIIQSVENSLTNLGTDHVDLLLIHRPDPLMLADEVAEAFVELKQAGKVYHFGVSNFSTSQFSLLQSRLPFRLATNQVEINPLNLSTLHDGTLDQCQKIRVKPMAWSPLAGGDIFSGTSPQAKRVRKVIENLGKIHNKTITQICLAWVMQLPSMPLPIIGTGKIARIDEALGAFDVTLTREEWFSIWEASMGNPVP